MTISERPAGRRMTASERPAGRRTTVSEKADAGVNAGSEEL